MAVFISYSHRDKDFVDQLAGNLMIRKQRVWVDRWEIRVGDSLIQKVQDALDEASALLVVLSKASVESEWCKKELNVGLMKEIEEKRVVVLPVLLEECSIPALLRDKYYADFRSDFDKGLRDVLEGIAGVTNDSQSRVEKGDYNTDWSVDWGEENGFVWLELTVVDHSEKLPFSVLTTIRISANAVATTRYNQFKDMGSEWFGRNTILEWLAESSKGRDVSLLLTDQFPQRFSVEMGDEKRGDIYTIDVVSRRLGTDTGKNIYVDIGGQFERVACANREATMPPSKEEQRKILKFLQDEGK